MYIRTEQKRKGIPPFPTWFLQQQWKTGTGNVLSEEFGDKEWQNGEACNWFSAKQI